MSTPPQPPLHDAPPRIMREAGAWLARRDRGFTASERAEFECWVGAHASHAAAVAQLDQTLSAFDRLRELVPHRSTPNCDAFAPARAGRRWFHPYIAAAGMAAAIAVMAWSTRSSPAPSSWHYETLAGGFDRATLADGSVVVLNGDTKLDVHYTASARHVELSRGEAHFQVTTDSERPFTVHAGTIAVRAVGTAFNVRFAEQGVEVLVMEGKVRVAPPESKAHPTRSPAKSDAPALAEIPMLTAGHKVMIPAAVAGEAIIATVNEADIERAIAWQSRVAEFRKTSLSEIVAEFNRQNPQQIVIADPELETLRIGGYFRADQPEAFVRLLESSFGISAERSGRVIRLRQATGESP